MTTARERHARESLGKLGKQFKISREQIRKTQIVTARFSDASDLLMSGKAKVDRLYRLSKGDESVGINIRVPFELRERIKTEAAARGVTMADLLVDYLTQVFG